MIASSSLLVVAPQPGQTPDSQAASAYSPAYRTTSAIAMPSLPDWDRENRQLDEPVPSACLPIEHFQTSEQLKSWARISEYRSYWSLYDWDMDGAYLMRLTSAGTATDATAFSTPSLTNNQVAGVDEADLMKTDGSFMYVQSGANILVVRVAPPQDAQIIEVVPLNGTLLGLLIDPLHLVVISAPYSGWSPYSRTADIDWTWSRAWASSNVLIRVYDRTVSPLLLDREVELNGTYLGARTIADHLFVVSSFALQSYNGTVVLPSITVDGGTRTLEPSDIGFIESSWNQSSLVSILHMELGRDTAPELATVLASSSGTLYVSASDAYLATSTWRTEGDRYMEATLVHKFPLRRSSTDCVAAAMVPGHIDSQFSLDEYGGYLRIATTSGTSAVVLRPGFGPGTATTQPGVTNAVYVLDANMTMVGALEGLAPGERIHSARFMGERLYLVTFKKVDPLFVIDLADPARPAVLGYLKIPGFSEYLHPIGNGLLIGVGRETVEATTGDFAWFQGLKLSLFDAADFANPREVAHVVIGDRGTWSPVLTDHRAFTWIADLSTLVLPVHVFEIPPSQSGTAVSDSTSGNEVWQGAYVFEVNATTGFHLTQRITHHDAIAYPVCWEYVYNRSESIYRSFAVNGYIYTLSQDFLEAHSALFGDLAMRIDLVDGPNSPAYCPPQPPPPPRPPDTWRNSD